MRFGAFASTGAARRPAMGPAGGMGGTGVSGGVRAGFSANPGFVVAAPQLSHLIVFVPLSHQADDLATT